MLDYCRTNVANVRGSYEATYYLCSHYNDYGLNHSNYLYGSRVYTSTNFFHGAPFFNRCCWVLRSRQRQGKPKTESKGSGGGMTLFCSGVATNYPDNSNLSRRIKSSEFKKCQANGVADVI